VAHDVFISYSSNDKPTADAACAVLEQKGIRCWIAPRDIVPGADWGESIIDAINDARALVLVFSSHANASPQIKREVERAVNKGIPIIPLRIEDVAPTKSLEYFISTPHWLDAYNPPLERHLTYLADVIAHILEGDTLQPRPQPVVRKSRRGVMLGAVAAICVLGALGAWYFTREPATPTFVGKWELASVTLGKGSLRPNGPAFATDWFAKAALEGPDVHGTFEVNSLGQYELALAATDRGAFVTSLEELNTVTFTSDITNTATTLKYIIIQPKTAKDMIDQIGGQEGESALLLTANPTHLQAMLAGKPLGPGPLGTFPLIAGTWHADVSANGKMPETHVVLEITVDGRYLFRGETRETGLWEAEGGKWTRKPQDAPEERGTYQFDGPNTVTTAGITGTSVWQRAD